MDPSTENSRAVLIPRPNEITGFKELRGIYKDMRMQSKQTLAL